MRRRDFMTMLGSAALALPRPAVGQTVQRIYTIGILWPATLPPGPPRMESLRQSLRQLDFVEGRNVVLELRHPRAGPQELPELAAELVRLKVDVIMAFGDHAPRVVQEATQTIPIVAIGDDVLGAGIITSLSRPGGHTTGLTILPRSSVPRDWRCCKRWYRECRAWRPSGIPRQAHHRLQWQRMQHAS